MADTADTTPFLENPGQLTQVKVPLDDAADAFVMRDASGRIPLVLAPTRPNRIRNDFVVAGLTLVAAGILIGVIFSTGWSYPVGIGAGLILIVLGLFRSFMVRVPEGASGLLARGGRYLRTIGSGTQIIPPWIAVSYLVTRRQIPFDVPVVEAPTRDNVRVSMDSLLTFTIVDPYRFVFTIATDDFDQVLQASCQEAIRSLIRRVTAEEIVDLRRDDAGALQAEIGADVEPYGVHITRIKITLARPPDEFARSQEQRQLAVLQRAEQSEKQALAQRRQADEDTLQGQRLRAQIEREREALQIQLQQAEARRQLVELDAEAERVRLAHLADRLRTYPEAAQYDWEPARRGVARALAGNTRAILQVGTADDIVRALVMRETVRAAAGLAPSDASSADQDRPEPDHEAAPHHDHETADAHVGGDTKGDGRPLARLDG